MKELTIANKVYKIPESWSDCTLRQCIKVSDLEQNEDEYKVLALVAGYADISMDEIKHMKIQELKDLTNAMKFVLEPLPEVPITEFDFNGKHYYTIESFLQAEAQDFFTTEAILQNYKDNTYKALPELLAVMCKQQGETLDNYDLQERAKEFLDLPMDIANGIRVFFYSVEIMSLVNSQSYLNRNQIVQQKVNECMNTLKKLDSLGWRGRFVARTLRKSIMSLHKNWKKYSSGFPSNIKE
jgi:hypothetical protein